MKTAMSMRGVRSVVRLAVLMGAAIAPGQAAEAPIVRAGGFDAAVISASSRQPVLVEFYADWCAYCRELRPVLRALEQAYRGRITFVRVDVDRDPGIAERFKVPGVPTVLVFDRGFAMSRLAGVTAEPDLRDVLETYVSR